MIDLRNAIPSVTPKLPLRRGIILATVLSLLFLASTAYTSVVTLMDRIQATDVMKAVSGDIWSPKIAAQVAYFGFAQVTLHLAMGALALLLAVASVTLWPSVRQKFGRILAGWFALLGAATLAFNALWYPRTFFGAHYYDRMVVEVGPFHVGQLLYGCILTAVGGVLAAACLLSLRRMHPGAQRRWLTGCAVAAAIFVVAMLVDRMHVIGRPNADIRRPNVILLGIDSLRLEQLQRFGGTANNTPHIDQFIKQADIVKDTSTPMARTFGSWVAILTGRSPPTTGARNNLTPRDSVDANPTLADVLREHGYRTIYSTDEVRFANIDQSYGFDKVVTPPIGASDFILGTYNELPLASVVINTRLGQLLFPFSYGNRGAAQVFEPKTFLARLDRELEFKDPTFLIVHLTAAHWPYYTAETPFGVSVKKSPGDRPMYRIGLRTADSMFDQVVNMLRRKGALDNAIVVVLSDHGEAMTLPNDAIQRHGAFVAGLGAPLKVLDVGHGQSVLSPTQYKVLLSFRSFGKAGGFQGAARDLPALGTVEDIAPTLLDLLGIEGDPLKTSGQSIAGLLRFPDTAFAAPEFERIRFTETDLAVIPNVEGEVDEAGTARVNSKFFGIEQSTSRMHIRHRMLDLVHAFKERAAFTSRHLLAAIPAGPYAHQYIYFDLQTGNGQLLMARPGPELIEGQRLWDALESHYKDELRPPTRSTMADWPKIAEEWNQFLVVRDAQAAAAKAAAANAASAPTAEGPAAVVNPTGVK